MTVNQPRRWASIGDAASYLSCNPKTIRRMIAAGDLPGRRDPKRPRMIRVDLNELDALMRPIPTADAS